MDDNDKQKVRKYWRNNLVLSAGAISSLVVLCFVAKEGWQTFKRDLVTEDIAILERRIELLLSLESPKDTWDLNPNINPLFELFENPKYSPAYKKTIIKKVEEGLKNSHFGISHHLSRTLYYSLQIEQALSKKNIDQDELEKLTRSLDNSLWYSYKLLCYQHYFLQLSPKLSRSLSQYSSYNSHDLQDFRSYVRESSHDLDKVRNLELDLLEISHDLEKLRNDNLDLRDLHKLRNFERAFFRKIIRVGGYLSLLEKGKIIEINIELISQSLYEKLKQIFELELSNNSDLTGIQESPPNKAKLTQLIFPAILSVTVLTFSFLLLIRQQNQGITWDMTGMYCLPEECVGELYAKYERLKTQNKSTREIRLIMLLNILSVLKGSIQVAIKELFFPSKNKRD